MSNAGNIVGAVRAEADAQMLAAAFVATADFRTLTETTDFNFIVGRRGTGKSALHAKVTQHFRRAKGALCFAARPEEFQVLKLQSQLQSVFDSYREMRAASRLAWKIHLLLWVLSELKDHYKITGGEIGKRISRHAAKHHALLRDPSPSRVGRLLHAGIIQSDSPAAVPNALAELSDISSLEADVSAGLSEINKRAMLFFDGLDEGWAPTREATAALGGLAAAVADLDERQSGLHGTLFVRDNMFRALGYFDQDFSRHIEGNALRLHWDEGALFQLVTSRLRVALGLESIENPEKIWNRFVDGSLAGRDGFEQCLHLTLYRPRDILVLVNRAYVIARRSGVSLLERRFVDAAATDISHDRLDDLIKEYDRVLPGLRSFVRVFEGSRAIRPAEDVLADLDAEIANGAYDEDWDGEFAVLGAGRQVMTALYGVGFLGFEDASRKKAIFCHDGSGAEVENLSPSTRMVIHPCYWKALEVHPDDAPKGVVVEINDEFDVTHKQELADLRIRQLGRVVSSLGSVPSGSEGAGDFEAWVLRAVKLLFAGKLANPELHPAPDAVQRRDVVATNVAEAGLWRRIKEDFGSRQIVFEVKNYESLKTEDYRQVLSYTSGEYGRFGVLVHRGESEGLPERDRAWIQSLYHEHNRLVLTLPDIVLRRGISKLRNADRRDYIEGQLSKRLDTFVRSYLSLKSAQRYGKRRRKKRKKRR